VKVSPSDVALCTEDFAYWAQTPQAQRAAYDSAAGLAQVTLDLLGDPALLKSAREEFSAAGGDVEVEKLQSWRCATVSCVSQTHLKSVRIIVCVNLNTMQVGPHFLQFGEGRGGHFLRRGYPRRRIGVL